ncbi:leucine-rich repeat domain-containing protein [Desulfonema ishimotonii]|nr:hypothetical protein [Desulfonema ishimotonii]
MAKSRKRSLYSLFTFLSVFLLHGIAAADICDTVSDIPKTECEALVELYNSTDGDNWTNKSGWLTDPVVGNWYGITVKSGHVRNIQLGSNNLTGTIPSAIGNFANAVDIYLGNNNLSGSIPVEIGNLSNLETLYLDRNQLTGNVPEEIASLTNLESFAVYNNQLDGCLPVALKNISLFSFYFAGNDLREPEDTDFQNWLDGLTFVSRTNIPCTICDSITDIPKTECEALVALYNSTDGDNWTNKDGWLTDPVAGNWNGVTVESGHVTKISLFGNNLVGTIPAEIANFINLSYLDLSSNQLSGAIPAALGNLANLQSFNLYSNQLNGEIPSELANLSTLQFLNLSCNQLSGTIPSQLGNLVNLQALWLGDNELSGTVPLELGNLSNLNGLSLNINQLSGCLPDNLKNLPLTSFSFEDTDLEEPQDADFQNWLAGISNLSRTNRPCETSICDSITDIPKTECEALVALYNSTDGDNWTDKSGWLTDTVAGNWNGVTVENGHVTNISLFNNNLVGTIPAEIGNFSDLKLLWLAENQLTGEIPAEIGNLTNLETLWLATNSLSGSVPAEIGNLTNLKSLMLHTNKLTGSLPESMGNLSSLEEMMIQGNLFDGCLPETLKNLASLFVFQFDNTDLKEPQDTDFQNWLNAITVLQRTNTPCEISICDSITDIPKSECEALVALYNSTDGDNWTNKDGWLTDPVAGNWHGVTVVGGHVTSIDLSSNNLTGTIPPELGNLASLQKLYLYSNQLSGTIPPELGNLASLQRFDLTFNQLSGTIPPELGNLANLEYLALGHNELSGTIPPELGNLASLQVLYLPINKLSGTIPAELGNLASLEYLWLSSNQLSGCLPDSLKNLSLDRFGFEDTELQEPQDTDFQNWLAGITDLIRTNTPCETSICDSITDIPKTECEALVALYNSTDGDNWTNKDGWLTDPVAGNWHGVTVQGGHVVEIELKNNKLIGTLPAHLGNFTNLCTLDLGEYYGSNSNLLSGTIPSELGNLINLQELDLSANQLSGTIPPELGNLSSLQTLRLSANQLSGTIPPN